MMRTTIIANTVSPARWWACFAVLSMLGSPNLAMGQEPSAVLPARLPVVPQLGPRRFEGPADNEKFSLQRQGANDAPVASLLESLQGNDAVLDLVMGQGRLLTLREPAMEKDGLALIAVGDPRILEFEILPNPRLLRLLGRSPGVTDLSIMTADGQSRNFAVHVKYDLALWQAQLQALFPEAHIKLGQLQSHVVVEGEARSTAQVREILKAVEAYVGSSSSLTGASGGGSSGSGGSQNYAAGREGGGQQGARDGQSRTTGESGGRPGAESSQAVGSVINLLRVPGVRQVMLQVRIAELNRTALREVGADLGVANAAGNVVGTSIGGAAVDAVALLSGGVTGAGSTALSNSTTTFGIFPGSDFEYFLRVLRRNSLLSIMAEPNLVAMSGHEASFLAGGQFPVPVPQSGAAGGANSVTVQYKDFGVQLNFLPLVLDDDVIRLSVTPEVSSIDFALGTTLVVGGDPVPGLNTRRANTTVELRQGQTLAMAGLLQVQLEGSTNRIPGLGDLPYLGPLFSNTSHRRIEKELVVLVTPYLVAPLDCPQGPLPGEDLLDPSDWELYFLNRIESRTGEVHRSTTTWDDPQIRTLRLDKKAVFGPVGFSECE